MNERIEKLAKQAGYYQAQDVDGSRFDAMPRKSFEKFAELLLKDYADTFAKVWYEQGLDLKGADLNNFMKRVEELVDR